MPIYDSTTSIQHQRVIQNLNRFNQHQQQQQQLAQQHQQLQLLQQGQYHAQQQQYDLRSKTPGPDICYFRDSNGANGNPYIANGNGYGSSKTLANGGQMNLRSKTPTAEMMYYPTVNGNGNGRDGKSLFDILWIVDTYLCNALFMELFSAGEKIHIFVCVIMKFFADRFRIIKNEFLTPG